MATTYVDNIYKYNKDIDVRIIRVPIHFSHHNSDLHRLLLRRQRWPQTKCFHLRVRDRIDDADCG